jgi:hypothetical protein
VTKCIFCRCRWAFLCCVDDNYASQWQISDQNINHRRLCCIRTRTDILNLLSNVVYQFSAQCEKLFSEHDSHPCLGNARLRMRRGLPEIAICSYCIVAGFRICVLYTGRWTFFFFAEPRIAKRNSDVRGSGTGA